MSPETPDLDVLLARVARARARVDDLQTATERAREEARTATKLSQSSRQERWARRYEQAVLRQDGVLRGIGLDLDRDAS